VFEKEAYEYGKEKIDLATAMMNPQIETAIRQGFKDGAEFGYNKGLEAGRPKWHKVADGDLPPENTEVLTDDGVKVIRINGHWRYVYGDEWEDDACVDHWCEIPKFEE
jgi:hypothetical protein